jgi:hypothetical protein
MLLSVPLPHQDPDTVRSLLIGLFLMLTKLWPLLREFLEQAVIAMFELYVYTMATRSTRALDPNGVVPTLVRGSCTEMQRRTEAHGLCTEPPRGLQQANPH